MNEKSIHILMVEDNEAHADLVRRAFESHGHKCRLTVAGTLEKALFHLEDSAPDLVIADLLLPDGTGMELLPTEEKDRRFPLIVMTSHGDEQVAVEAIKAGALDYVVKSDVTIADMPHIAKRALREWALINERRQAEAALRESEARYRALSENMSNGVAIYQAVNDGMDFILVEFNKAAEEIERIKRDSIIGKSVVEAFPGVRDFGLFEVLQRVWATGNPEHHPVKMYKDERIVGWRRNFVYKLPCGEIVAVYSDETKRKKAEEALRLEKDNLINILDSMEDGVYVVNQKYDIEYLNPSLKREFGPFEGKKCHEYFHDWKEACPACTNKDVFSGKTVRWEWPSPLSQKTYDFIATPLKNPDGSVSQLGILRDVTERKRAEEELRRANRKIIKQQKSVIEEERLNVLFQMAGATAHELNQPLMTLLGSIDLMRLNKENPEKLARHSAMIEDAGQRISDIVKKIQTIRHYETKPYLDKSTIINLDQKINILSVQDSDDDFRMLETATMDRNRIMWTRVRKITRAMELLEQGQFDMVLLDYLLSDGNAQDFLRSMENRCLETPVVVVITGRGDEMAAAQVIQAGAYDYITKDKLSDKSISQVIDNTLEKAHLRKEISEERKMMAEMTNRDELTGLYNRRYFMEALTREVSRAQRYESDLVLCLMDLDHFKSVNDTHGQNAGNVVLFEIGKMLKKSLRQSDLVCRYGYEEFAAILPNTDLVKARIVCERFRELMSKHYFRCNASRIRLTVSMGLASCRDNSAQSPSRLIRMSDQALYQAKEAGRNNVVELR